MFANVAKASCSRFCSPFRRPKTVVARVHQRLFGRRPNGSIERHPNRIRATPARVLQFKHGPPLLFRDGRDAVGEAGRIVNDEDSMFLDCLRQCGEGLFFAHGWFPVGRLRERVRPGDVIGGSMRPHQIGYGCSLTLVIDAGLKTGQTGLDFLALQAVSLNGDRKVELGRSWFS